MEDPVSVPCCGANFERRALLLWMQKNRFQCPLSGEPLQPHDLVPNTTLQWEILYLERKNSTGQRSTTMSFSSSSPASSMAKPCVPLDIPPSMPRSPSSSYSGSRRNDSKTTGRQSSRKVPGNESLSSHAPTTPRVDLPPTMPRSASATTSGMLLPLKRMDSAPSLPQRRTIIDSLLDAKLSKMMALSQGCDLSRNAPFMSVEVSRTKKDDIISVIDDVLAVLADDEACY